ncbi:MAG: hypothetical protein JNK58_10150 [Phycisphaerae bacterium]|nr:hypothetical protein [Phycisphaerae bacterium]
MSFPVHDWQFWAVTVVFLAAVLWVGRGLLPGSAARRRRRGRRAMLTLGGKAIDKK